MSGPPSPIIPEDLPLEKKEVRQTDCLPDSVRLIEVYRPDKPQAVVK